MNDLCFFWFRRDLRLNDNAGLYHALRSGKPVVPLFIFDKDILDRLESKSDARVEFIHRTVSELDARLRQRGSSLLILHGNPLDLWKSLCEKFPVHAVYTNLDREPYAMKRDKQVAALLYEKKIVFHTHKDHMIFDMDEVLKDDGTPYTVFTPYSKKWKVRLNPFYMSSYPCEQYFGNFHRWTGDEPPSLEAIGFKPAGISFPPGTLSVTDIRDYEKNRDFPSRNGTSRLSVHFRFGTVSIREMLRRAWPVSEKWVNELIWRDFYLQIMGHFPHAMNNAFKPAYDRIEWENNPDDFEAWCTGRTGYPIVDAGMRELTATGYMHNRVRMIVASFLCKHLLIDWRWGEAFFAKHLLDFDLASNNGGWQWAAGSGTDAAPYFRVFNPTMQCEKFDPGLEYVRKWVPEYGTPAYVKPIIEHSFARARCLSRYASALK